MTQIYKFSPDIPPDNISGSLLCHTHNNKFMIKNIETIRDWNWFSKKYGIDWYGYCDEIEELLNQMETLNQLISIPDFRGVNK